HLSDADLSEKKEIPFEYLRQAVVEGSVIASFNVESFSMDRLRAVSKADIAERYGIFRTLSRFEAV
ncbi:MAG: hypothetical protein RLZZ408_1579, partial [Verrucomicrobiota bacterium]